MSRGDIHATDKRFAERLRLLREEQGLSGPQLAIMSGLPRQSIYDIERGKGPILRRVSVGEAVALAAALGVDLSVMTAPETLDVVAVLGRKGADQ